MLGLALAPPTRADAVAADAPATAVLGQLAAATLQLEKNQDNKTNEDEVKLVIFNGQT